MGGGGFRDTLFFTRLYLTQGIKIIVNTFCKALCHNTFMDYIQLSPQSYEIPTLFIPIEVPCGEVTWAELELVKGRLVPNHKLLSVEPTY